MLLGPARFVFESGQRRGVNHLEKYLGQPEKFVKHWKGIGLGLKIVLIDKLMEEVDKTLVQNFMNNLDATSKDL